VASSGLPVTYRSDNPSVAAPSGSSLVIVGAGSATITASQEGNAHYRAAPPISRMVTVSKAGQTIAFDPLPVKTAGDAPFPLHAVAASGLPVGYASSNPRVASIAGNTVTIRGPGTTNITASQPGNSNYAAAEVTQALVVTEKKVRILKNPVDGVLQVRGMEGKVARSYVQDLNGKSTGVAGEIVDGLYRINVAHLHPGLYLLTVQTDQGVYQVKFLKQ
jgi:hypothetical protein